jgi:hypothetical protein
MPHLPPAPRLIPWIPILCTIAIVCTIASASGRATAGQKGQRFALRGPSRIAGGSFEASGVAAVRGTAGVLFVDDSRGRDVFWMRLGPDGRQRGTALPVRLGVTIADPEDLATDGSSFFVVGSQSKPESRLTAGLARFQFDTRRHEVTGVESIAGFGAWLLRQVPELAPSAGSLNIGGLAWDPLRARLWLGLRTPLVDGRAMLVPLTIRNPHAPFTADNLAVDTMRISRLALGGVGVRGLDYDPVTYRIRIIAGEPGSGAAKMFGLFAWDGESTSPSRLMALPPVWKPEGLARVTLAGVPRTIIVFDTSRYQVLP